MPTNFNQLFVKNKLTNNQTSIRVDTTNTTIFEQLIFQDCKFYKNQIEDYSNSSNKVHIDILQLTNHNEKTEIIFSDCEFKGKTIFSGILNYTFIFNNCYIENIFFDGIVINNHPSYQDFKSSYYFNGVKQLDNLKIKKCNFGGKFYINDQKVSDKEIKIDSIKIEESTFNENFKLHRTRVEKIKIDGIDFEKNADFFRSTFINGFEPRDKEDGDNIVISGTNFKALTIFENCIFDKKFIMKYVTFNGLAQFRNAYFKNGLDLDKTNSESLMNFYDIHGLHNVTKTSRETYRIIKYNLEKVGDIISSNKYYSKELERKRFDLDEEQKKLNKHNNKNSKNIKRKMHDNRRDRIVFNIHWHSSKFGTDWITPIYLIIALGFSTFILLYIPQICELEFKSTLIGNVFYILEGIDKAFSYMYILNKDEYFQEHSFIFLMNKIILGYLYYQFLTAVRKDTRK